MDEQKASINLSVLICEGTEVIRREGSFGAGFTDDLSRGC